MEKYINKTTRERFVPLASSVITVAGGTISAIKLGEMADKAEAENKKTKASILRIVGRTCGWIAGLTALGLPDAIKGAMNGKKISPEYQKEIEKINLETCIKLVEAESQYQSSVQKIILEKERRLANL